MLTTIQVIFREIPLLDSVLTCRYTRMHNSTVAYKATNRNRLGLEKSFVFLLQHQWNFYKLQTIHAREK